jgi:acetate---CoA ligase (ADP-forming)
LPGNTAAATRALMEPENTVIFGASASHGDARRIFEGLAGPGGYRSTGRRVYLVGRHQALFGEPCYPSLSQLPDPPDHVIVLVPASAVAESILDAARLGARSASIRASGFEPTSVDAENATSKLKAAIAGTNMGICGPNCLGQFSASSQFSGVPGIDSATLRHGPIAVVSQSGAGLLYLYESLADRGLEPAFGVSSGNELGLTTADYLRYFATQDELRVILAYTEGIPDIDDFCSACAHAQAAGKTVVCLKAGSSPGSRGAAIAHTGSLAGDVQAFDAVTSGLLIRVGTPDELLDAAEFLSKRRPTPCGRLGGVTYSGGMTVLLLEAGQRHSSDFPRVGGAAAAALRDALPVDTSPENPIDTGYTGLLSVSALGACVKAMIDEPAVEAVVVQERLPTAARSEHIPSSHVEYLNEIAKTSPKPIVVAPWVSYALDARARATKRELLCLPIFQTADAALSVLNAISRYSHNAEFRQRQSGYEKMLQPAAGHAQRRQARTTGLSTGPGPIQLVDEVKSKAVLAGYGFDTVRELVVEDASGVPAACTELGYPVVIKGVTDTVVHKSKRGLVHVAVTNEAEAVDAASAIVRAAAAERIPLDGLVVAEHIFGIELALGMHLDDECGAVQMFGAGGEAVEFMRDVCFVRSPPWSTAELTSVIRRTRVGAFGVDRYGGRFVESVSEGLQSLDRMWKNCLPQLLTVDVNPCIFVIQESRLVAVDASLVFRAGT